LLIEDFTEESFNIFCEWLKRNKINILWEDKVKRHVALDRKYEEDVRNKLQTINI